jgi:tetratricopeptide (TPR) repeat protein
MLSWIFAQNDLESNDFSYPLKLYNQEFYDLAAQQFIKFYNNYPHSSKVDEAKFYAGMSFYNLGEYDQARIEFQSLALEYPRSKRAGEGWFKAGESNLKLGRIKEAAKSFESIRLLYPDNIYAPNGLIKAGNLYLEINNQGKAYQLYSVILERYSSSKYYFPAMAKAGRSLLNLNELQKSKNLLNKVLEGKADSQTLAETYLILAEIYLRQGYFEKAKENLIKIVNNYPKSSCYIDAVLEIGKIYLQENNYTKAQKYLIIGISNHSDSLVLNQLHHLLGDVYYLNKKYALAEKEYKTVKFSDSDSISLIIYLKRSLAKKKQNLNGDAIKELGKNLDKSLSKQNPFYNSVNNVYLDWLEQSFDYQLLISKLYEQINEVDNADERIPLSLRLVKILYKLKHWRDIIRELQPFLLIQNKYPEKDDVIYYLAAAYENISDFEESAFYYKQLVDEFSASKHFRKAKERLSYLYNYSIVDKDLAVNRLASLISKLVNQKDNLTLKLELGKIYYNDIKDYQSAEYQFKQALLNNDQHLGDVHLYLGKTYLKLANRSGNNKDPENYLKKANIHFTKAVENISTCATPDEASWFMVKTTIGVDTVSVAKEKKYIEMLIKKYPKSKYMEEWQENLAFTLAFDHNFIKESINYYKLLINNFKKSPKYPSYLNGYAKLINESKPEEALEKYKEIASDYPFASEAASALYEVAEYYEGQKKYTEASVLYKKFLNYYYYSDLAVEAQQKLGLIYQKAGLYDDAIEILAKKICSPFISDYVLSKEFLSQNLYNNVYLLAKAYAGNGKSKKALEYYKLYLNIAAKGEFRDRARFDMGEIYYFNNKKNIALDYFNTISRKDSFLYNKSRLYSAEIYFDQDNFNKAASIYSELTKLFKDKNEESEIYGKYIVSVIRNGKFKEAKNLIKLYKKKFSKEKNYLAQFTLEIGKYFRAKKEFTNAIKYFKEIKKKYKNTDYVDDADYNLALTYITLNKTEEAYKILSNFYTNYAKSDCLPPALNTQGSMYFRSEKYDAAINIFKNALQICKDPSLEQYIISNLIKTYTFTGFWDAAQGMARQYVEKFPYAEDKLDKKIIIAQAYINLNQFQNAVDYLKKIKLEADSEREPEIQYYIGEALLKAGQYENAIAEFVKIPLLSKKTKLQWEASALYYSGQAYEKLGRISDAVRMYKEIIRRPGIDMILKKDAEKRIKQIQG